MAAPAPQRRRPAVGGAGTRAGSGIAPRIVQSWIAPARVVRGLRGMPDAALVVVLLVAMLIFWLAQAPQHAREAALDPATPLVPRLAGSALAVLFLLPLLAYGLAEVVALLIRLTPWRITGAESRLALFWALLAVAPAMLLSGLVGGFIGPGPALTVTRVLAGLGFAVIWIAGIVTLSTRSVPR